MDTHTPTVAPTPAPPESVWLLTVETVDWDEYEPEMTTHAVHRTLDGARWAAVEAIDEFVWAGYTLQSSSPLTWDGGFGRWVDDEDTLRVEVTVARVVVQP